MKNFILSIIALIMFNSAAYSQSYATGAYLTFMQHKSNARAEAMGRGNAALTGDTYYMFDNPASTSFIKGADITYTYLEPNMLFGPESTVNLFGASYNTGKYGSFGFIYQDYLEGTFDITTIDNVKIGEYEIRFKTYIANYSYKFSNDLSVGINGNFYHEKVADYNESAFLLDIGLLKKFAVSNDLVNQDIYAGVSFNNVLNETVESEGRTLYFPVFLRAAGAYEITYNPTLAKLIPLKITICAEYQDVLTNKYQTKVKFGGEAGIFEILQLRVGHFDEFQKKYDDPFVSSGNISELTYGFGLNLPLYKLSDIPLELKIDYTKLSNSYYIFGLPQDYKILTIDLGLKF